MTRDPMVQEIHKHRERYLRKFKYDLDAMFEDLKRKQSTRNNVSPLKPCTPSKTCVAEFKASYRTK